MSGKNVTQKITSVSATSTMFWATNIASREKIDAMLASDLRLS